MDATGSLATIADPTRARILRLILGAPGGRARVGELAEELGLRQPTVSHHMRALRDEGLVVREPDGRRAWFSVAPDHIDTVASLVGAAPAQTTPDLDRISADLALRFRGTFSPETVEAYVHESHDLLSRGDAPPKQLASRTAAFAATRLEALARAQGERPEKPEVLFVCVQNAGRSQLAAAILRHLAGDRVSVRTAGSMPAPDMRSTIATALDEIGVPVGGEFPKPLTDEAVRAADVVITMGCGDACPIYPGRRYLDWELDDPAGLPLDGVRPIRDDIERRIRGLLDELV
ncbi:metalloregulator ArsR/SmtB family transcription factor [Microbacterium paludicola]|uniref:Metalloregulator ArsR/SmtB family transcription factor n=1 Tax=Microbacterium paludicola TaxID=300019 RepID=A0A4Y9FUK5_9MICO|nr:metalloregulator ArsR/SmtB family transcription factor [Microbacterium paludicola]MBF0816385.1 metalloregulator ArsR/SmtB family transcription factor [Microbacterium paludicola]TFU32922.1 metalloregulator ArsR/SmtB family transcription factor [Microbacterium paludicola]